ncbi:MAG: ATP synthase F1 subunit epsilon [Parcubacteria group bacterium]|nr:ATP synthase F1 subunit epsilon [Parcubacteria group bacterium]MCR4342865.1 ATP synthase F1 subunit epsilon [Patescibacteria group bacterium]
MPQKTIKFEIVTPERVVFREVVLQATIPTKDGEITVLPNHIPLISILKPGVIELKTQERGREIIAVSGGFIEVLKDKIVILADTAEKAEEIDLEKTEEARKRAEKIKIEGIHKDDVSFTDATIKIEKEIARAIAVKRWKNIRDLN